jgi:hypothetical protein
MRIQYFKKLSRSFWSRSGNTLWRGSCYWCTFKVHFFMQTNTALFCCLKGLCHEIFCFRFFSWIISQQAPEKTLGSFSNFLSKIRRYSQVKVHQWYQRHRRKIATSVNGASGKVYRRCSWFRCHCHRYQLRRIKMEQWSVFTLTMEAWRIKMEPWRVCRV